MHAKQKRKRLGGLHCEHKRDHQGEGRGTAYAWQQANAEAQRHADQHQTESFPLED